jgi:hypothetical protein
MPDALDVTGKIGSQRGGRRPDASAYAEDRRPMTADGSIILLSYKTMSAYAEDRRPQTADGSNISFKTMSAYAEDRRPMTADGSIRSIVLKLSQY